MHRLYQHRSYNFINIDASSLSTTRQRQKRFNEFIIDHRCTIFIEIDASLYQLQCNTRIDFINTDMYLFIHIDSNLYQHQLTYQNRLNCVEFDKLIVSIDVEKD